MENQFGLWIIKTKLNQFSSNLQKNPIEIQKIIETKVIWFQRSITYRAEKKKIKRVKLKNKEEKNKPEQQQWNRARE